MHNSTRRNFLRSAGTAAGALAVGVTTAGSALALDGTALDGAATARAADAATEVLRMARVWLTADTAHLADGFDDTHRSFGDGSYEFLLWPGDLARLVRTGLRFEITVDDVVARDAALARQGSGVRTVPLQPGETEDGEYRQLADYEADMRRLAQDNPGLVKLIELPYKSLEERTVYGLEICEDVERRDGRPVYYQDGVHHAREWPAGEVPIMWAFDLVEAWNDPQGEPRLKNIVRNVRNVIVPIVNVDGFHYSREVPVEAGGHQAGVSLPILGGNSATAAGNGFGQYWRKNRRQLTDGSLALGFGTPPDGLTAYGVDPNRNYSYQWGGDGSSDSHLDGTYRGEAPFSEPESRNVQWIHQTYQCLTEITHHTSGDLVLWAWGDTAADAPDDVLLARLGIASAAYNGYQPTKSIDLYVTTGTCSDYTYGTWASISYTFEHAGNSFHPEYGATVPAMYEKNRKALMLLAEVVCLDPEQRDLLRTEVAADESLRTSLQGEFSERIEGRLYEYTPAQAIDLGARYNCIITGRLVDEDGDPVRGTVEIAKSFQNFLWRTGSGQNPIETTHWPEMGLWEIDVDEDGRFRWAVNPSSRPAYEDDPVFDDEEAYTVTFRAPGRARFGSSPAQVSRDLVLRRGQVVDLGDIRLGGDEDDD